MGINQLHTRFMGASTVEEIRAIKRDMNKGTNKEYSTSGESNWGIIYEER